MTDLDELGQLRGDAALAPDAFDAIGLRDIAARLAEALAGLNTDASLVIGIEGRWGSGKSSLLAEVEIALDRISATRPNSLVHFRPWLIGNRDALLGQLFADLERAIAGIKAARGDNTRETLAQARRASEAARKFAAGLARAGGAVELVGDAAAFAPLKWGGKALVTVGGWLGREPAAKSLHALRARLVTALKVLDHRIIVTIDDIDRLEPAEMLEVLRLVRSVGDLPGVLYLLCYDSKILAHGIKQAASIEDGQAYLEKIVQLTVPVPLPETFQLRHWFEIGLAEFAEARDEDVASRLKMIVDIEGGRRLTTPRAVVRALEALRFLWPMLDKAGADLADLVWLQLIKDGNPGLYRWIERYCATAAELSLGTARVDDEEKSAMLAELTALEEERFGSVLSRHYFAEQLPGLEINYGQDQPIFSLFDQVSERQRDAAIAQRRLTSPDHYRLYFALSAPSHALKQADFDVFWKAAEEGSEALSQSLIALQAQPSPRALSKADIMLERIRGRDPATLSSHQCSNTLVGFANGLDELYRARPFERDRVTSPWDRAERLISPLLAQLNDAMRAATIDEMFSGSAISWLTSLFRRETFAHGRAGDRAKLESERYFSGAELDRIAATMLSRYQALSLDAILNQISPMAILFAWIQGGDEVEIHRVKTFVADQTRDDILFLRILDALRSTITTSEACYRALRPDNVEPFFSFEATEARLEQLAADGSRQELAAHARILLEAAAIARDF